MSEHGRAHLMYLLQIWRAEDSIRDEMNALAGWRASLTDPATKECLRFVSLSDLFAYLERRLVRTAQDREDSRT